MSPNPMSIETFDVQSFTKVVLRDDAGAGAVYIEQGTEEGLQIEAEPDLLRRIEVGVRDNTLYIRLGGSWLERLVDKLTTSLDRPKVNYRIKVKEIQSVDLSCANALFAPGLKADELRLNLCGLTLAEINQLEVDRLKLKHAGMGKLAFKGSVRVQEVHLNGSGLYAAYELLSDEAVVNISGSSQAQMHATKNLDVIIRGMGSVKYRGAPNLRQQVLGMGGVVHVK